MKDTTLSLVEGSSATPACDVVFFHGLIGDPQTTWKGVDGEGKPTWWPQWPLEDFQDVRVWMASYDTSLDAMLMPAMSMPNIARAFFDLAELNGLGQRPLLWVGHSMGGLVIKQVLRLAADHSRPEFRAIAQSTRAIQFLGTPHQGSTAASMGVAMRAMLKLWLNLASVGATGGIGMVRRAFGGQQRSQLKELERNAPELLALQEWFIQWAERERDKVALRSYYETQTTGPVKIVDESSGRLGLTFALDVARNRNHIEICKFTERGDTAYQWLHRELNRMVGRKEGLGEPVAQSLPPPPPAVIETQVRSAVRLTEIPVASRNESAAADASTTDTLCHQVRLAQERLKAVEAHLLWDAIRDAVRSGDPPLSLVDPDLFVGGLAAMDGDAPQRAMVWIRRALFNLLDSGHAEPAVREAAVALFLLCACRWIDGYARQVRVGNRGVVEIAHASHITTAVISAALFGGRLVLKQPGPNEAPMPEYVFDVSPCDGDAHEASFEIALYVAMFPTSPLALDVARRDFQPNSAHDTLRGLTAEQENELARRIRKLRGVEEAAFAFVLPFAAVGVDHAAYRIVSEYQLPVFRVSASFASATLGMTEKDLFYEIKDFWDEIGQRSRDQNQSIGNAKTMASTPTMPSAHNITLNLTGSNPAVSVVTGDHSSSTATVTLTQNNVNDLAQAVPLIQALVIAIQEAAIALKTKEKLEATAQDVLSAVHDNKPDSKGRIRQGLDEITKVSGYVEGAEKVLGAASRLAAFVAPLLGQGG